MAGSAPAREAPRGAAAHHRSASAPQPWPASTPDTSSLRLAAAGPAPASAAELLGLAPDALRHRLGEPDLRRVEGTAEIWLYTGQACALDVILYGDRRGGHGGGLQVAHAAARASGTEPRTEAACLAEIAAGARPAPAAVVPVASGA
jgi:hypothetical protein